MISNNKKQAKIQEYTDLLNQIDKIIQKQEDNLTLTAYETKLINSDYKKWQLTVSMLQSADIEEDIYNDFLLYPSHYKIEDEAIIYNESWEEEVETAELTRIANLKLTAADVERALYQAFGYDFDDIISLASSIESIDIKALKIELNANYFYRGNEYISQIGSLLGLTQTQLNNFFETGDYTKLLNTDE